MALPTEIHPFSLGGNDVNTFKVANSLRFRLSNSAYLLRSFPTAGNRKTWTFSAWVKRGLLTSGFQSIFGTYTSGSDTTALGLHFHSDDCLRVTGWSTIFRVTTQVFRDPTAWYHIVWAFDSTQATAANRSRIYINGSEITAYSTNNAFTQNTDYGVNQAGNHSLGVWYPAATTGYGYLDGYLSEVNFIDGQQLTPSAFAQTDVLTGAWQPKKYTGTYGTNGFYLPFNTPITSSYAGTFNGSSQYLTTATNAGLALGTSDFTVEYWVNFTAATNGTTVCSAGSGANSFDGLFGYVTLSNAFVTYLSSTGSSWDIASGRSILSITTGQWYHIAFTRSGSTWRVFVNGTQVDTFTSAASLYQSASQFALGRGQTTGYFNGLLSNVRVIKGTALYTANFNPPIAPLTAVTNTQLLTLQDSTIIDNSTNALTITNTGTVTTSISFPYTYAIAADKSGNGNQWMTNNMVISASPSSATTTHDSMYDSPTNYNDGSTYYNRGSYATLNPVDKYSGGTTANGNLYTNGLGIIRSTFAMSTGKWYWEVIPQSTACIFGIATKDAPYTTYLGGNAYGWGYYGFNGNKYANATNSAYGATFTTNDIIGVAFDADSGSLSFYKNGVSQGVAYTGLTSGPYFAASSDNGSTAQAVAFNFGQMRFSYTPPTGYLALNTYNLPNPSLPLV